MLIEGLSPKLLGLLNISYLALGLSQFELGNKSSSAMKLHPLTLTLMMLLMMGTWAQDGTDQEGTDLQDTAQTNSTLDADEESVSETIAKVNQKINQKIESHLMEGDIAVDKQKILRNAVVCRKCKWPKSRSKVMIRYCFDHSYNYYQKSLIRSAMKTIESRTCVRFKEFI
ncbi:astacin-like metalloendopeptidase isoform X1 [Boleophthalmus pectinirostris]|uniref:astacin-like metalloendopeptidase isoform X1 n=1 Tax=Boleophthalmus pectinirostris TaxID=150288 RepID=UPI00242D22F1|nr:astacin-like metalloendopeptidase isoform X1 [Boleophthalmus pectinirostris]